jgi:site-specific DNA-cytosine methylase
VREKLPADFVNVVEKEPHLCKYLCKLTGTQVEPVNVRTRDLKTITRAHILVAGPPCPPFARGGAGEGWDSPDAELFLGVIDECAELDSRGDLEAVILENAWAITESRLGKPAPIERLQQYWANKMPGWLPLEAWKGTGIFFGHSTPIYVPQFYTTTPPTNTNRKYMNRTRKMKGPVKYHITSPCFFTP